MSELRTKAETMIVEYRNSREWDQDIQVALMVFNACWSQAHTIEQINRIGGALASLQGDADLQATVTAMVRGKLLRTRRQGGKKFYELNY